MRQRIIIHIISNRMSGTKTSMLSNSNEKMRIIRGHQKSNTWTRSNWLVRHMRIKGKSNFLNSSNKHMHLLLLVGSCHWVLHLLDNLFFLPLTMTSVNIKQIRKNKERKEPPHLLYIFSSLEDEAG